MISVLRCLHPNSCDRARAKVVLPVPGSPNTTTIFGEIDFMDKASLQTINFFQEFYPVNHKILSIHNNNLETPFRLT
jgi:hypothetical protein